MDKLGCRQTSPKMEIEVGNPFIPKGFIDKSYHTNQQERKMRSEIS